MPNLVRQGADGISVNYTTLEPETTTSLQLEMGEPLIHRVEDGQTVVKMADFSVQGGEATKTASWLKSISMRFVGLWEWRVRILK